MKERVSIATAAKELGISKQAVREYMKRGIFDIGEVIPPDRKGSKNCTYLIFRRKLDKLLGKEEASN